MTPLQQLTLWIEGQSVHNDETDECCPDFSCCNPQIKTPQLAKERFWKAVQEKDKETIIMMHAEFLECLLFLDNWKCDRLRKILEKIILEYTNPSIH
jgi:hypothetical protein